MNAAYCSHDSASCPSHFRLTDSRGLSLQPSLPPVPAPTNASREESLLRTRSRRSTESLRDQEVGTDWRGRSAMACSIKCDDGRCFRAEMESEGAEGAGRFLFFFSGMATVEDGLQTPPARGWQDAVCVSAKQASASALHGGDAACSRFRFRGRGALLGRSLAVRAFMGRTVETKDFGLARPGLL